MNIEEFKIIAKENCYEEDIYTTGNDKEINKFIDLQIADLDLKIYLTEVIIYRHFAPIGLFHNNDVVWFLEYFFNNYEKDLVDAKRTNLVTKGAEMILKDDPFGESTIATVFMFGIIEFYTKFKIGFRPHNFDFFDNNKKEYADNPNKKRKRWDDITLKGALAILTKKNIPISESINRIDKRTLETMKNLSLTEERFIEFKIADRLNTARNAMLHGINLTFYDKGKYMLMLYFLFF